MTIVLQPRPLPEPLIVIQPATFSCEEGYPCFVIWIDVSEHGAIILDWGNVEKEYGLPAVVGVENATTLIKDGQRIRVHGTDGYVEVLEL